MKLFTNYRKKLFSILCVGMSISGSFLPCFSVLAAEAEESVPVRETDVQTASDGCVMVRVEGIYEETDAQAVLARLNEIRYEACKEGVMNPKDGEPLTMEDYVPLKWSTDLENSALTRAAEASLYADHVRPNGQSCFSFNLDQDGLRATNETLAWGYGDILQSVDGWYTEKEAYLAQTKSEEKETGNVQNDAEKEVGKEVEPDFETIGVTGHYVALIDPDNCYVGVADFSINGHGDACAAEFSSNAEVTEALQVASEAESGSAETDALAQISEAPIAAYGKVRQEVEVREEGLSLAQIWGSYALKPEAEAAYETALIYVADNCAGKYVEPVEGYEFSSSESSVLSISEDGKTAKAMAEGVAVVTARVKGTSLSAEKNIEVSTTIAENAGWNQTEKGLQYRKASGELLTARWIKVDGSWYCLDADGYARQGWYLEKEKEIEKWYYFDEDGAMVTGWLSDGEKWYYLSLVGGTLQTGWVESHGKWYYMSARSGGEMVTGKQVIDGKEYTFGTDGVLQK